MRSLRLFIIFCFTSVYLNASVFENNVRRLTIDDGFSENMGYGIIKDCKGFIWKAGFYYLDRYDGYEVKSYLIGDKNTHLTGDKLEGLFEDAKGQLWVITNKGFLRFDRENDIFEGIPFNYLKQDYVVDDSNRIWLAHQGISFLDFENKQIVNAVPLKDSVTSIINTGNELWICVRDKLMKYNKKTSELTDFQPLKNSQITSYKHLFKDKNGLVWVINKQSVFLINPKNNRTWEWHYDILPDDKVKLRMDMDKSGNLWIASDEGCFIFPYTRDRMLHLRHNPNDPLSLSSNVLTDIYIDNHNVVWFTTLQNGISYIDLNQKPFRNIRRIPYKPNTLSGTSVYAISRGPGTTIWIGTENGLDLYNYKTDSFKHILLNKKLNYVIDFITSDTKGNIYFTGKYSRTLCKYNPETKQLDNYKLPESSGVIRCILNSRNGRIYIGTISGSIPLLEFNPETKTFTEILPDKFQKDTGREIFHIIEDSEGLLWIGIKSGCLVYEPYSSDCRYLPIGYDNTSSQANSPFVHYIYEQKQNGTLWFATAYGLFKLTDKNKGLFKKYDIRYGFPSNTIENILEDTYGNLWLGTNRGLSRFNPETEKTKNYTVYDGIQGNHFEHFAACKTRTGELCFGGLNGFNLFSPGEIQNNPFKPQVSITGLKVFYNNVSLGDTLNERVILEKTIEETKSIRLNSREKAFSIQYSALHFSDPRRNQYAYYLEGFENQYNYAGYKREATYTNLPPGNYVFYVKASNADGVWSDSPQTFSVSILPPWWKTSWAIAAYILLLGLTVYLTVKLIAYQNHLKQEIKLEKISKEKEAELTRMKLRFFTNISHEFKTPLTLIIGYLDQLLDILGGEKTEVRDKLNKAKFNSRRLLKLITQLIDFRKYEQDVLQLNRNNEDIVTLVQQVLESFQASAGVNKIRLKINSQFTSFEIPIDRDKIENVLYNLISNAIKFSYTGGNVVVKIFQDKGRLMISVADEGIGIAPQHKDSIFNRFYQISSGPESLPHNETGSGIGLSFSKKLVELHGGCLSFESTLGKGTVFTIELPFQLNDIEKLGKEKTALTLEVNHNTLPIAPDNNPQVPLPDKNAPKILIVEDNAEMRDYISSVLLNDYHITEAENGKTGLDLAVQHNPDLIISDIMMPVMNGIDFCKALKTNIVTSHIPIILLSAKNDPETKLAGLELNVDDYLEKPFSQDYLLARVKNILSIREKLRLHFSSLREDKTEENMLSPLDQEFLSKVKHIIEERIADTDFNINILSKELSISRVHLYRKFSSITGLLPKDYVKQVRLNKAAKLLSEKRLTVAEIAYAVGYSAPSNFNFAFKNYFGKTPKEYQEG